MTAKSEQKGNVMFYAASAHQKGAVRPFNLTLLALAFTCPKAASLSYTTAPLHR